MKIPKTERNSSRPMSYTYAYPRPAITVDIIVTRMHRNQKQILLILRKNEPFRNRWALPGGFIGVDERIKDAALRELYEETGLTVKNLDQFHVFDEPGRDPRERTITVVFTGNADDLNSAIKPSSDAKDAKWIPIDDLPELGFDHSDIISLAKSLNRI
jgi:8-oxo-dGTP diphosphatase